MDLRRRIDCVFLVLQRSHGLKMQLCFFCLGWGYLGGLGSPRNGFGLEIAEIRIMTLVLVSADNDNHDDIDDDDDDVIVTLEVGGRRGRRYVAPAASRFLF